MTMEEAGGRSVLGVVLRAAQNTTDLSQPLLGFDGAKTVGERKGNLIEAEKD